MNFSLTRFLAYRCTAVYVTESRTTYDGLSMSTMLFQERVFMDVHVGAQTAERRRKILRRDYKSKIAYAFYTVTTVSEGRKTVSSAFCL